MVDTDICPKCIGHDITETRDAHHIQWIQCDVCNQWYHAKCLGLSKAQVSNFIFFHCMRCAKKHGGSELRRKSKRTKVQIDYAALNDGETFAVDKKVHPHVEKFLSFEPHLKRMGVNANPYVDIREEIDMNYCLASGLKRPVLLPDARLEKVGMEFPLNPRDITIDFISDQVGEETGLEVMDVLMQQGVTPKWNLGLWREYFLTEANERDRIRNVISLEISQYEGLGKSFIRPKLVREWDLVDKVWGDEPDRPKVTKYCLMSVTGSFTDFHLDFSGTLVYYTICSGSKVFMMYPPTDENLALYTEWCLEQDQNYIWFPDYSIVRKGKRVSPSGGFKVELTSGDLFMIPCGWIHSVYTPEDTIVIGGNYLTLMNIPLHARINQVEKDTSVPQSFRFPKINKVFWLCSWYYYNHKDEFFRDLIPNLNSQEFSAKMNQAPIEIKKRPFNVLKTLIEILRSHHELSKTNMKARESVPTHLIGKDVNRYLQLLQGWLSEMKAS